MEISVRNEGHLCIVSVQETRIDAAVALTFKDAMRRSTEGGQSDVVLDLRQVEFIDSSGLGAIVATMKFLAPDRALILAGLTTAVEKVFKLTRMDSVFSVFSTLDQALVGQSD
ncbi:MAG: STAS domain-containing protein [Sulfitobacter sp.]